DGVYGQTDDASYSGVTGITTATADLASGVYGEANAATGKTYGVMGITASSNSECAGVIGYWDASNFGALGLENSSETGVFGVYGMSDYASGAGVMGEGLTSTDGVYGQTDNTAVNGYAGVTGYNDNTNGVGLQGIGGGISSAYTYDGAGVYGEGSSAGVVGISNDGVRMGILASDDGVYGENDATGASQDVGVYGINSNATGIGIYGSGANFSSFAYTNGAGVIGNGTVGVYGATDNASGVGVTGSDGEADGFGVYSFGDMAIDEETDPTLYFYEGATTGAVQWDGTNMWYYDGGWHLFGGGGGGTPGGADEQIQYNNGGVFGGASNFYYDDVNNQVSIGVGTTAPYLLEAEDNDAIGIASRSINIAQTGTGLCGTNDDEAGNTLANGSGIAGTGYNFGLFANCTNSGYDIAGGYFDGGFGLYAYTAFWNSGDLSAYGIISNGTKSTIVNDIDGNRVAMFCTETPEVLFQDFGKGKLTDGKTHIELDPIFSKNTHIDNEHPLKVFIQLEGNCNGVYVTNKTPNGFDVIELNGGTSNVEFMWMVVANRADAIFYSQDSTKTKVSNYSQLRFPSAPGPQEILSLKKKDEQTQNTTSFPQAYYDEYGNQIPPEYIDTLQSLRMKMFTYDEMKQRRLERYIKQAQEQQRQENTVKQKVIEEKSDNFLNKNVKTRKIDKPKSVLDHKNMIPKEIDAEKQN
ncbi:hypothetical protein J7L68_09680, partial [bacterium]|nr:hypothetical protein [bacterium]